MVDHTNLIGYKKSETGVIPEDWTIMYLGNPRVAKIIMGQSPPSSSYNKENKGLPFLQGNADFGVLYPKISVYCTQALKTATTGDVLVSVRAPVGELNISPFKCIIGRGLAAIRSISGPTDGLYLFYYLKNNVERLRNLSAGSTFDSVNKDTLMKFEIALPPLSQQRKISKIISDTDALIESLDVQISKKKNMKQGLMQMLLTRGMGHTKFKKTESGEIPEEWEIHEINDICEKPQYGYTQSAISLPVGPKFLRITDIQDGAVFWHNVPYCSCPDNLIEKYVLKHGDILFARTGATTGKSYLVKVCPRAVFASYLIRLRPKKTVDSNYLYSFFNSFIYWRQIGRNSMGSAQGGVNANTLSKILSPVPRLDEQQEIAKILSDADKEIEALEQKRDKYKLLKTGMMQQLLTGGIRVK